MKNEKGITLITLAITLIILMILTFTITLNMSGYQEQNKKTNFRSDLANLTEEVEQYYIREKKLPCVEIIEGTPVRFDTSALINRIGNARNVNDNDIYYIIDINKLRANFNYGSYVNQIIENEEGKNAPISNTALDIFVINQETHTIYYPRGIEYNGQTNYSKETTYTEITNVDFEQISNSLADF